MKLERVTCNDSAWLPADCSVEINGNVAKDHINEFSDHYYHYKLNGEGKYATAMATYNCLTFYYIPGYSYAEVYRYVEASMWKI